MRIEDVITPEELKKIFALDHERTKRGVRPEKLGFDISSEYVAVIHDNTVGNIETGAAIFRTLCYIAKNLELKNAKHSN